MLHCRKHAGLLSFLRSSFYLCVPRCTMHIFVGMHAAFHHAFLLYPYMPCLTMHISFHHACHFSTMHICWSPAMATELYAMLQPLCAQNHPAKPDCFKELLLKLARRLTLSVLFASPSDNVQHCALFGGNLPPCCCWSILANCYWKIL